MRKTLLILSALFITGFTNAQEFKTPPQITVSGEGKVKVIPDQVAITVTIETKGTLAKEVKKLTDQKVESVLKFIKKMNLDSSDFKTQMVSLNPQYDYEKKKYNYNASQTIELLLKDLTKYDELMEGLVNEGVNRIDNATFQSSKLAQYQSEARKLAMKEAKLKAEDYVFVLGQKVGKAIVISDSSQLFRPQPIYEAVVMGDFDAKSAPRQTLAAGEINITANVNVSFILE
jgi:uncharacterized protein YggE